MSTQIELAVGQTWQDEVGDKRTIRHIENDFLCYMRNDLWLDVASSKHFLANYAHKLIPTTVRKSQCVMKYDEKSKCEDLAGLFATEKDARDYCADHALVFISWPLVVNGVEQWVEVPSE